MSVEIGAIVTSQRPKPPVAMFVAKVTSGIRESQMKHFMSILALTLVLATVAPHGVHASPESRVAANLLTMAEATLSAVSLILDHTDGKLQEFSWTANYSERDWLIRARGIIDGEPIGFTLLGYLWGQDKEDWVVQYSGLGTRGKQREPVRLNGKAEWHFDKEISDYREMDFYLVVKFGDNSFWAWVLGAEVISGAIIGGAGGLVTTGGIGLVVGALGGATAAASISSSAKSMLKSDRPVDSPEPPKRPDPPQKDERLGPKAGQILVAVAPDGRIWGSGPNGTHVLSGKYNSQDRSAAGSVNAR